MSPRAARFCCLALVLLSLAVALVLLPRLPDPVPTHWTAGGVADGFTPKPLGAFLGPLVMLGLWGLLQVLPRISPHSHPLTTFERTYAGFQVALLGFIALASTAGLLAAAGAPVPISRVIPVGLAVLLLVLGNALGKVTRNFFVGIRTPWTLASEEVWLRTHRLAGRLLVLASLVALGAALLSAPAWLLVGPPLAAVLAAVAYSFFLYRRLEQPHE